MRINKKVWPEYFQRILDGVKKYELRLADWKCDKGDILVLREWDPKSKEYSGRTLEKKVTMVIKLKNWNFGAVKKLINTVTKLFHLNK